MTKTSRKTVIILSLILGVGGIAATNVIPAMAQQGMGMGMGMMHMFAGEDTTEAESLELRDMFADHQKISRSVENLPNGIRTLTETKDPALREALVTHVTGMINRVDEGRDPRVPIQSPTLDILFQNRALIVTEMEPTDSGILVIQTSEDPATVAALQKHAAEVSDLAARGLQSVHQSMMQRMHGG